MTLALYVEQTLDIGYFMTQLRTNQKSRSNDIRIYHCLDVVIITLNRRWPLVKKLYNRMSVFYVKIMLALYVEQTLEISYFTT